MTSTPRELPPMTEECLNVERACRALTEGGLVDEGRSTTLLVVVASAVERYRAARAEADALRAALVEVTAAVCDLDLPRQRCATHVCRLPCHHAEARALLVATRPASFMVVDTKDLDATITRANMVLGVVKGEQ